MMTRSLLTRRSARMLAGLVALTTAVACNDSTAPEEHEEEVEGIRLTIVQGNTTRAVTYRFGSAVAPMELPVGTSTVTATFLDADDVVIDDLDPDEHTLAIQSVQPASALTFQRTGAFAGTITAPAAGTATVTVCLTHGSHCDLEFTSVPVVIGGGS